MSRTQELTKALNAIFNAKKREIWETCEVTGPKCGNNALNIKGWKPARITAISRAVKASLMPWKPYWEGYKPTPTVAIPACCYRFAVDAYKDIFDA